ncbi:MAG TPA: aldo/keto reductase [Actinomycetales bacterium]|nr:aldo/keto reductase [Actinomycetales bacterium]
METRRLGRLEHQSSVIIYGAAALGDVTQDEADQSIQQALDGGINHYDVAASYGDAELRLGPWMPQIRDRVFLATKTGERDRDAAWAQINASLERLQTDHVDLLQLHAICTMDELDSVTRDGGALEAAVRAQDEGLVGAVGITGHGPVAATVHLEGLRRYPFATVLTPLNAALGADRAFQEAFAALVAEVQRQDAGLMTIKTAARRNWPGVAAGAEVGDQQYATWYQPLDEPERVRAAVSWVLAHDELTGLASPGDIHLLGMVLDAEANRMSPDEAERLLGGVEGYSSPFERMPA